MVICRGVAASLAVVSGLMLLAVQAVAQVPPLLFVVPAPTPDQVLLAYRVRPRTLPIGISEAKAFMAWSPTLMASGGNEYAKVRIGIVDEGFRGLDAWLAGHPAEQGTTKPPSTAVVDPDSESDHGYWVYRVMRALATNAELLLFRTDGTQGSIYSALTEAAMRGVVIVNQSLERTDIPVVARDDPGTSKVLALLRQSEMFLFAAAGNDRLGTHTWVSADQDANGYVDFFVQRPQAEVAVDEAPVWLKIGRNEVQFSWDVSAYPDARYELELRSEDGKLLASRAPGASEQATGALRLVYLASVLDIATVRVRQTAGPARGVLMRLSVDVGLGLYLNGLQSIPNHLLRDSPFLVTVGSFGVTANAKLSPSGFSNFGVRPDGAVAPDVLGPGQLLIDGRVRQGTSFATPFLAAIYSLSPGYNIKNLIARSAGYARLDSTAPIWERSRWGVPDQFRVYGSTSLRPNVIGPTTVENVTHERIGDDLVVRFTVTRCCMEAMTWVVGAYLFDPRTGAYLVDPVTNTPVQAARTLLSDSPDYDRYPVEVRIPVGALGRLTGQEVGLGFSLLVRAWSQTLGTLRPDEAPRYRLML